MSVLRATVYGVVQGVGFRWYVRGRALRYELTGRVANRPDGAVEIEAEGERASLEGFLAALHDGPGRIDRIEHVIGNGALAAPDFSME
jgi:acylphosphatase